MAPICACVGSPSAGAHSSTNPAAAAMQSRAPKPSPFKIIAPPESCGRMAARGTPRKGARRYSKALLLFDVERLGAGGTPVRPQRNFLDSLFGAGQQL